MTDMDLYQRLSDVERRLNNFIIPGKITEIDAENALVKVEYAKDNDGEPVITNWLQWAARNGDFAEWMPPSVGESVRMHSPSGELGQHSLVTPGSWSDANPAPHNKASEYKLVQNGGKLIRTVDKDGNKTEESKSVTMVSGRIDHNKAGGSGGYSGTKMA